MNENESAAKTGGGIAKKVRLELESKTGKKVVSAESYLPPSKNEVGKRGRVNRSGRDESHPHKTPKHGLAKISFACF